MVEFLPRCSVPSVLPHSCAPSLSLWASPSNAHPLMVQSLILRQVHLYCTFLKETGNRKEKNDSILSPSLSFFLADPLRKKRSSPESSVSLVAQNYSVQVGMIQKCTSMAMVSQVTVDFTQCKRKRKNKVKAGTDPGPFCEAISRGREKQEGEFQVKLGPRDTLRSVV